METLRETTSGRPRRPSPDWKKIWPPLVIILVTSIFYFFAFLNNRFGDGSFEDAFTISVRDVFDHGEWYRLIAYMFMHGGFQHLGANMILLYFISTMNLELESKPKYFAVYLLGGVLGGLLELLARKYIPEIGDAYAYGASSAIMGLVGSTLVLILMRRKSYPEGAFRSLIIRLILLALFNIIPTTDHVDYLGHFAGFIAGAGITFLLATLGPKELKED